MATQLKTDDILVAEQTQQYPRPSTLSLIAILISILTQILFIYVVVSGGVQKGIIVILATIILAPLIYSVILYYESKKKIIDVGAGLALILMGPSIAASTSVILTIIMAIYIYITPTPSTIV